MIPVDIINEILHYSVVKDQIYDNVTNDGLEYLAEYNLLQIYGYQAIMGLDISFEYTVPSHVVADGEIYTKYKDIPRDTIRLDCSYTNISDVSCFTSLFELDCSGTNVIDVSMLSSLRVVKFADKLIELGDVRRLYHVVYNYERYHVIPFLTSYRLQPIPQSRHMDIDNDETRDENMRE
jgi:hypothetical protein